MSQPSDVMPARTTDGNGDTADEDVPADGDQETDSVDEAEADPGMPSDSLQIVPQEPRRMRRGFSFDCRSSVEFLRITVASLFFIIFLLAIVVGYMWVLRQNPQPVIPAPITRACMEAAPRVCDRPGCVLRAAETVRYLNRSVDPCRDFYSYACGGFSQAHPTGTLRPLGVRQVLERRNRERLLALLREEQFFNTSSTSAIAKAKVFFSTCMSSFERGDNKVMALVDMLTRLGGLELFGTWTIKQRKTRAVVAYPEETLFDFNDVLSNTSRLHPEQAFFEVRFDRQLNLLVLSLPKLAMGFVEAVTRPGSMAHAQLTARVKNEIHVVLAHLEQDSHGGTKPRSCHNNCIDIMAEDILAVQDALAVIRPDLAAAKAAADQRMTLSDLVQLAPQIDWRRLLDERYGEGVVPDTVAVQVPSSDYMAGIGRIIDDTRFQRLYHFLVWPVIRNYLVGLGPVYATLSEHLDHEFGLKPLKSREKQCLALLQKHMEPALRGLLLSAHIGEKNLPHVRDLLKQARGPLIDSFSWMHENSQRASEKLLDSINVEFGDAPSIFGPLDDYFSPLQFNAWGTGFFHNLKQLYGFSPPVKITQSPLFGSTPPDSATIRYDVQRRTLTVPYGALQRPWFDADVPPPLNAAALGSFVYDAFAVPFFQVHMAINETYHWDKETLWRLDDFTDCVTNVMKMQPVHQEYLLPLSTSTAESTQYHFMNFSTPFAPEVVTFLLSREYFAYHLSHRLYSLLAEHEADVTLPGLHLNGSEQAFYLAFAQVRCHNGYPEEEEFYDFGELPRLPQAMSINSLVHSDPEFRKAFQCGSRRPVEDVFRDIGSCQLFKWPKDGDSSTPATTAAKT